MIAQPLVIEHEVSDLDWKLRALPLAFFTSRLFAFGPVGCRLRSPDRIGRRTQLVCGHMSDCYGLAAAYAAYFAAPDTSLAAARAAETLRASRIVISPRTHARF